MNPFEQQPRKEDQKHPKVDPVFEKPSSEVDFSKHKNNKEENSSKAKTFPKFKKDFEENWKVLEKDILDSLDKE